MVKRIKVSCCDCGHANMITSENGFFTLKWRCQVYDVTIHDRTKVRTCAWFATPERVEEDEFVENRSW